MENKIRPFVPFDRVGGELLFNLISHRYERRATMVTTIITFSEWVPIFSDEKLATTFRQHSLIPEAVLATP